MTLSTTCLNRVGYKAGMHRYQPEWNLRWRSRFNNAASFLSAQFIFTSVCIKKFHRRTRSIKWGGRSNRVRAIVLPRWRNNGGCSRLWPSISVQRALCQPRCTTTSWTDSHLESSKWRVTMGRYTDKNMDIYHLNCRGCSTDVSNVYASKDRSDGACHPRASTHLQNARYRFDFIANASVVVQWSDDTWNVRSAEKT